MKPRYRISKSNNKLHQRTQGGKEDEKSNNNELHENENKLLSDIQENTNTWLNKMMKAIYNLKP